MPTDGSLRTRRTMLRSSSESAVIEMSSSIDRDIAQLNEQRVRQEMAALSNAMRLLTRFVSCSGNTLDVGHPNITEEHLLDEIENLLSQSEFLSTSTPFPHLLNSCVMMRDALRLTALESDEALSDAQQAQEARQAAEERVLSAHDAVAQLRHENGKLKAERKSLARQVRSFMDTMETEKKRELSEAYAFITHEMVLQSPERKDSTQSRQRTPLSDDAEKAVIPLGNEGFREVFATNTSSPFPNSPTVIHPKTPTRARAKSTEWKATVVISPDTNELKKVDKQRRGNDISTATTDNEGSNVKEKADELIPAGNFLATRMNDGLVDRNPYTIHFSSNKIGLELMAIPSKTTQNKTATSGAGIYSYRYCKNSFIVTGYKSYTQHKCPELGSRLVSLDGESLEYGTWTLRRIGEKIRSKKAGGGIKLTFRNDTLPEDMVKFLNKKVPPMSSKSAGEDDLQYVVVEDDKLEVSHRRAASTPKIPLLDIGNLERKTKHDGGSEWRSPAAITRKLSLGSNHRRKSESSVFFPALSPAK
mmetsp:Transcript_2577/g.5489  ORF Transcript_2577/g.5489 Transcript_2577/m.5489 type:complete len:532 (+) Transcript_2577:80-1675(+)